MTDSKNNLNSSNNAESIEKKEINSEIDTESKTENTSNKTDSLQQAMKNKKGFGRWWSASLFSWQGFRDTYKTEEGFRQELLLGCFAIPLSFFIASTVVEWILLILTYLMILFAEITNTSMEATVNRFGPELNEFSGKAKDAGSAGVMIAIIMAVITWGAILIF